MARLKSREAPPPETMLPPIASISLQLEHPWWLFVSVACFVPLIARQTARERGRPIPWSTVVMQIAAGAVAAAALARPVLLGVRQEDRPWLIAKDVSASTRGQHRRAIDLPANVEIETLNFAADMARPQDSINDAATNLAPLLRLIESRAREGRLGGAILETDGRFTDRDWPRAAAALARYEVPLLIVPLADRPPDARLMDFAAGRRDDGAVDLRVDLIATAPQARMLTITRRAAGDESVLLEKRYHLLRGAPAAALLTDADPPEGLVTYIARLDAADELEENDRIEIALAPQRRALAIVADDVTTAERFRTDPADQLIAPAVAPTKVEDWLAHAGVVLIDPEGDLLRLDQRAALAESVTAGGGLVIVGSGPRSCPADLDDPLNRAAALVANPFERQPLAVTLVLDASGSMAQADGVDSSRRRFDHALDAAVSLKRHLTDKDTLTVLTFAADVSLVYVGGEGEIDFAKLDRALRAVTPAGPTNVWPAMDRACEPADGDRRRLILIVSDLATATFDVAVAAERFDQAGASLAVVAIGQEQEGAGSSLAMLCTRLNAPLVVTDDPRGLAEIFGRFVRANRGSAVREGRFMVQGDALARPFEVSSYLLSAPAADSTRVLGEIHGHPILAVRHVGLGRSVSLAVPLAGGSPDGAVAARLASVVTEWAVQPLSDPRVSAKLLPGFGKATLYLKAFDGDEPIDGLLLTAMVIGDGDSDLAEPTDMEQVAPGCYEVTWPVAQAGRWLAVVDEQGRRVWQGPMARRAAVEFNEVGPDWEALEKLARLTGGRLVRTPDPESLRQTVTAAGAVKMWPILMGLAVLLTLLAWLSSRSHNGAMRRL